MSKADEIKKLLNLQPNAQEGGRYNSVYTSPVVLPDSDLRGYPETKNGRPVCSAIYYFLECDDFSALHKVTFDMIYHFYCGHPVEMLLLHPDGSSETVIFSNEVLANGSPLIVIPGGTWLGTRLVGEGSYALMSVSLAPGFDPADYIIGTRAALTAQYPSCAALIEALTRS